ncbi:MAG: hypothetical protein WB815_11665 [Nitrososphaeraceae archaeon]
MVRAIPEMVAYPYPVGYDVINYYIPVITNFQEYWPIVSEQYPLYVLILHFFQAATELQPQILVSMSGLILYGFFSVSLFIMSRRLFGLGEFYSLYLTLFVIFQLPVLRTAWDLHKDILSLTLFMIAISIIFPLRPKIGWYSLICSSFVASVAVTLDKMIGALLVGSFLIYGFVVRSKYISLLSLIIVGFFAAAIASDYGSIGQPFNVSSEYSETNLLSQNSEPYSPKSLLTLFLVVNCPLLVPAGFGLIYSDNRLLKIAVAISAIGSFSWVIFPDMRAIAADRWIFVLGIFLSIFAGYGIVRYAQTKTHPRFRRRLLCLILGSSIILGLTYETMPYHIASFSENMLGQSIEPFGPATMQFNSIAVKDTGELLKTINWINENVPKDAIIIGEKHWRGWMEIKLQEDRSFLYYSDTSGILQFWQNCRLENCYFLARSSQSLENVSGITIRQVYHNNLFTIYEIDSIKRTK